MIRRLVLRSLRHRPGRSLLLLAGYALGVGVTVALLSIGSAMLRQSRDRTLVGGGDLTVLPAGLDLETFRTGGVSSLYFTLDQAPFLYRQVLAGPRFADRVAAAAPWMDDEVLYLELPGRDASADTDTAGLVAVSAGGRIPSLARRLDASEEPLSGSWEDAPADRRWTSPGDSALYAGLDAFHLPPPEAAGDSTWAEWHYFNVLLPEGRGWLYLTYMVAGEVPDGRWGGRLLATLVTREGGGPGGAGHGNGRTGPDAAYRTRAFRRDVPPEDVRFSLVRPDLAIGGATLALGPDGDYRLRAEIPPEPSTGGGVRGDGGRLRVELTVAAARRSYLPPLDVAPGSFPSGYVVPMLDARTAGRVCVGGSCRELEGAPAYHDHNWGSWGGVAWDWGFARAGPLRLLYGGVRREAAAPSGPGADGEADGGPARADPATAGRRFLFVTDSLGFAGLLDVDRLEHRWRPAEGVEAGGTGAGRAEDGAPGGRRAPARRPVGLTVEGARGPDTIRLDAEILHARSTRAEPGREGAEPGREGAMPGRKGAMPGRKGARRGAGDEAPPLFWQMRGEARVEGRLHGRPVSAAGDGFFETWAPPVHILNAGGEPAARPGRRAGVIRSVRFAGAARDRRRRKPKLRRSRSDPGTSKRTENMHPKRFLSLGAALALPLAVLACGGGEQGGDMGDGGQAQASEAGGGQAAQQAELTVPDWFTVDEANESVTLTIVAGQSNANNNWNYNGYHSGDGTIVVPEGWEVTIEFSNEDQVNAHSISIEDQVGDYAPTFTEANAVFEGAHTQGPTEMATATQPGQSETITFTASTAGEYAMVCLVPAHAAQGMWLHFNVSADGEVGWRGPSS